MKRLILLLMLALSLSCAHSSPIPAPVPVPVPVSVPAPPPEPPPLPTPLSRQEILDAHESFQGAVLHTSQFGDLNWWPAAWVSLNAADREASYAQIMGWGDTDITISSYWEYGENGQPYGTGQLVPHKDYVSTGDWGAFRETVKDVLRHASGNGKPFVPVIFMAGDNGFSYYMWAMPQIIRALQSQPQDDVDLTRYVKLRMCYDSCVPGWQPPSQVDEAILATRQACPDCVISLEFSSGYPFWGGTLTGGAQFASPAGQALDEVLWEGNTWPPNNWEQYWEILDRWLGPLYRRPAQQVSDTTAPFGPGAPQWYLSMGTPRGPFGAHCFEPGTYPWVRGQLTASNIRDMYTLLSSLGCPVIDMPVPR